MEGKYYRNGLDLYTSYGITVLKSTGEIELLTPKERLIVDWPDEDGHDVLEEDLIYMQERVITLECMIKQSSAALMESHLRSNIQNWLYTGSMFQFKSYKNDKRVHLVYIKDVSNFIRYDAGKKVLFKLTLVAPRDVSRQYHVEMIEQNMGSVQVNVNFLFKPIDIYWGDSSKSLAVTSNVSHTYNFGVQASEYKMLVIGKQGQTPSITVTGTDLNVTEEDID